MKNSNNNVVFILISTIVLNFITLKLFAIESMNVGVNMGTKDKYSINNIYFDYPYFDRDSFGITSWLYKYTFNFYEQKNYAVEAYVNGYLKKIGNLIVNYKLGFGQSMADYGWITSSWVMAPVAGLNANLSINSKISLFCGFDAFIYSDGTSTPYSIGLKYQTMKHFNVNIGVIGLITTSTEANSPTTIDSATMLGANYCW